MKKALIAMLQLILIAAGFAIIKKGAEFLYEEARKEGMTGDFF